LPFKKAETKRKIKPGEVIHTDICGPMSVESLGGSKYFVTFKDEASGFRHVYFIKHKSDMCARFKEYKRLVANKFGQSMKILRSDNEREYCNQEMKHYLATRGIVLETTSPYTPQQNGKSERDNRTIVESARTMIQAKKLPLLLWAEAVNTAVYVLNRTLSSINNKKTPYEMWMSKAPATSHLRIFGSDAYEHIDKQFRKKFEPKATKTFLVGYQGHSINYCLYNPSTKKISVSKDVIFKEESFEEPSTINKEGCNNYMIHIDKEDERKSSEEEEDNEPEVREEQPVQEPAQVRQLRDRKQIRIPKRYEADIAELIPATSFQKAMSNPDVEKWIKVIKEELEAHKTNNTWTLIPKNQNQKTINSKWVFKVVRDTYGKIHRFKARLCARGFLQKKGFDYTETFSPVVRYDS
jgi:hypothetical protein